MKHAAFYSFRGMVTASCQKLFDRPAPNWLVSLDLVGHGAFSQGRYITGLPQVWAVVDDFGDLVFVRDWS